jgi:hypothetical protein
MSIWGRSLIILGVGLIVTGVILMVFSKIPWLGRLPGDIRIQRGGFSLYVPLTTCILLSLILSFLLSLWRK